MKNFVAPAVPAIVAIVAILAALLTVVLAGRDTGPGESAGKTAARSFPFSLGAS